MTKKPQARIDRLRASLEKTYTLIGEDLVADTRGAPVFCDPKSRKRFEQLHRDLGRTLGIGGK